MAPPVVAAVVVVRNGARDDECCHLLNCRAIGRAERAECLERRDKQTSSSAVKRESLRLKLATLPPANHLLTCSVVRSLGRLSGPLALGARQVVS